MCVCVIGLRHIAILKLVGTEQSDMGGVLELYPINGKNFSIKLFRYKLFLIHQTKKMTVIYNLGVKKLHLISVS